MVEAVELDKIPPQSLEAEVSLLGSILIDKDAMMKVADLVRPEDFYKNSHAIIFEAMQQLYAKNEPIDLLTLSTRLNEKGQLEQIGGRSQLAIMSNAVPTASNINNYARIVHRKAVRRRLLTASHEISRLGYQEEDDLEKVLDEAQQHLFGVSQDYFKQSFSHIRGVLADAFDRIDELHKNKGKLRGLPTGFRDLDNVLSGLQKSDLVVLAARPSCGKTSLALDIARHVGVREKIPVALFSLEMSKEQLVDRLLCSEANVDMWRMRTGRLSERPEDDDFPRIGHAIGVLSEAPIFIDDNANTNILQIRTKARRLQSEHGLGMIVIDYLQLMESRGDSENRVQEVAEITRGLKGIARELDVPILALSQLSRVVEQSKPAIPKLSHLRESGCLAGETLLMRADTGELVPIKNLVGQKNIPIFSLTNDYKLVVKNISKIFSSGRKQIFELKTQSGRVIHASANHPFMTINGWRRLDNLTASEHITTPRTLSPVRALNQISNNELILLAHLLGDGCVLPRQPIHYTSADSANLDIVTQSAKKLFQISPRLVKQKNWYHVYLPAPYRLARGKRHPITRWFEKLGIKPVRSYEKKIPAAVFSCDNQKISLFLHHLWATDGNISFKKLKGRKISGSIYYSSSSEEMTAQVQHLLLRLGINSVKRRVPQKRHRSMYTVNIQGTTEQLKFCHLVGSFGKRGDIIELLQKHLKKIIPNPNLDVIPKEAWATLITPAKMASDTSWRELAKRLGMSYCGSTLFKSGLSRERLTEVAAALHSQSLLTLAASDVYWDKIISIKPLKVVEVFDAEVPGTHNFVANDIIVHNSIEQDADVVMFIYRKAADRNYRLEEIPPDERHIAEIHIAKHRNGPTGTIKLIFKEQFTSFRNMDAQYNQFSGGSSANTSYPAPTPTVLRPKSAFNKPAAAPTPTSPINEPAPPFNPEIPTF